MKQTLIIVCISCIAFMAKAQDELGIAGSTRSPTNTVFNNPSSIVDSRAFIDINLVGVNVFARNTFVYLYGSQLNGQALASLTAPNYNRTAAPYSAYVDVKLQGPSVTFAVKQHSFGIHTAYRVAMDARVISESLSNYMIEGFQYLPQQGVQHTEKDLRVGALSWGEIGVTYGTILSQSGGMLTQAGITVKRLMYGAGVGLRIDDWTYTVLDSSNMETTRFRGEYGFIDPGEGDLSSLSGKGWSFDLGVTFKQRKSGSSKYTPHSPCTDGDDKYRLGFSLLDVGSVKFTGPFYRNVFDESDQSQWSDFSNTQPEDASDLDSLFNAGFGVAQSTSDQSRFRMMLPTAFSAQFDYNLGYNFYVYGVITAGVPWKNRLGVQRASYIGVAPRWETKRFEVALPVSMFEFRRPMVGAMVRLNSIIVGSDDLLGFIFKKREVYVADVYVSIKYTMFKHWKCKTRKTKDRPPRRRSFDPVPCPTW